jgi:signal peptidase II
VAARTPAGGWGRLVLTLSMVVAVDQATKQVVVASVDRGESVNVFLGLDITNTRNSGVAFGQLQDGGAIIGVLIAAALIALLAYFATHSTVRWLWLPAGLLLGGAIGNLVDRIREGAVVDFIDPIAWPAFNVADMSIVAGVLLLLFVVETQSGEG